MAERMRGGLEFVEPSEPSKQPEPSKPLRFSVLLKKGHPTGVYHRGGTMFHAREPVLFEGTVPAMIAQDLWLVVTEV